MYNGNVLTSAAFLNEIHHQELISKFLAFLLIKSLRRGWDNLADIVTRPQAG
jgi:hypothetical protein